MTTVTTTDRSEAGMTLVEILVAVAILGIAVVGIVSGLGTASLASDRHRKQATADTVVKSYAEAINQKVGAIGYVSCTTAGTQIPLASYAPSNLNSGFSAPTGYSASVTSIRYWNTTAGAFQPTCPGPDNGAQLLTLSSQSSDGRDTEIVEVVVRKP
jgi:prepilin-type N-terminal cleavage/methylation domain-containing protein